MNKKTPAWFALGLLCAATAIVPAVAAHADPVDQDVGMRPYISLMGTDTFSDAFRHGHNRESKNGYGGYLGGGFALSEHFGLELGGLYSTFAPNGAAPRGSWREYGGEVQGLYFLDRNPHFEPYLVLGVGGVRNVSRLTNERSTDVLGDAGIGAMSFFNIGSFPIGVRVDARYRYVDLNSNKYKTFDAVNGTTIGNLAEPVISVGVVFPLGSGPQPAPPPPPAQTIENSAATPPPPAPTESANRKFENVHFAFDKYNLTDYAKASLDGDAQTIGKLSQSYPNLEVDVAGHTDWIGTEAYNQALSERRANAVRDYLETKGVDASRIRTFAYGETRPIAPNTTAEGRALNRRAEISTKSP